MVMGRVETYVHRSTGALYARLGRRKWLAVDAVGDVDVYDDVDDSFDQSWPDYAWERLF